MDEQNAADVSIHLEYDDIVLKDSAGTEIQRIAGRMFWDLHAKEFTDGITRLGASGSHPSVDSFSLVIEQREFDDRPAKFDPLISP